VSPDFQFLAEMFTVVRSGVAALRDLMSLVPANQRKAAEETLEKADVAFRTAEAKLAKELGYMLCQCTWPPQIMTRVSAGRMVGGALQTNRNESWKCPKCRITVMVSANASRP
jgi:hypothetical protein